MIVMVLFVGCLKNKAAYLMLQNDKKSDVVSRRVCSRWNWAAGGRRRPPWRLQVVSRAPTVR